MTDATRSATACDPDDPSQWPGNGEGTGWDPAVIDAALRKVKPGSAIADELVARRDAALARAALVGGRG